ncbi:hypothetical protein BC628DRAFT_1372735 [Trametes gibbosa]|nr:hypothetical protein BC628DRAFT_1372735 [Trametes gibbosa]
MGEQRGLAVRHARARSRSASMFFERRGPSRRALRCGKREGGRGGGFNGCSWGGFNGCSSGGVPRSLCARPQKGRSCILWKPRLPADGSSSSGADADAPTSQAGPSSLRLPGRPRSAAPRLAAVELELVCASVPHWYCGLHADMHTEAGRAPPAPQILQIRRTQFSSNGRHSRGEEGGNESPLALGLGRAQLHAVNESSIRLRGRPRIRMCIAASGRGRDTRSSSGSVPVSQRKASCGHPFPRTTLRPRARARMCQEVQLYCPAQGARACRTRPDLANHKLLHLVRPSVRPSIHPSVHPSTPSWVLSP